MSVERALYNVYNAGIKRRIDRSSRDKHHPLNPLPVRKDRLPVRDASNIAALLKPAVTEDGLHNALSVPQPQPAAEVNDLGSGELFQPVSQIVKPGVIQRIKGRAATAARTVKSLASIPERIFYKAATTAPGLIVGAMLTVAEMPDKAARVLHPLFESKVGVDIKYGSGENSPSPSWDSSRTMANDGYRIKSKARRRQHNRAARDSIYAGTALAQALSGAGAVGVGIADVMQDFNREFMFQDCGNHSFQKGQTAKQIAEKYGVSLADLLNANLDLLPSGDWSWRLTNGQQIKLPCLPQATSTPYGRGPSGTPTPAPRQIGEGYSASSSSGQPAGTGIINYSSGESSSKVDLLYGFQLDLDPNLTLIRAIDSDSIESIARETGISAGVIRAMNGIPQHKNIIGGEILLLPTSGRTKFLDDRRIENASQHDVISNVVARVLPRPEIGPEDFTSAEITLFNTYAKQASEEVRTMLGPPTKTGFIRIQAGTQMEARNNNIVENGAWIIEVDVPNKSSSVGLMGSSFVSRIYIADRFGTALAKNKNGESNWYQLGRYLSNIKALIRHEVAHYHLGDVLLPSPFDNHNLVYAIDSLSREEIPDRRSFRYQNTIEWYLIRQNPQFFASFVPWVRERTRTLGRPPTTQEVIVQANQIYPTFNAWKALFDSPIGRNPIKGNDGNLYVWEVRYPNGDEMAQGWFSDSEAGSIVKDGFRLYRSHRKI